ncbi:beta-lactamase family protein [Nocardia yamanashiensis]|uniref:serine hydrolase domain-containing protein n=1 Tax=Nocardia yamanashiensis TaxID=209247 RepID=UPI001E5DD664|nr:serine hydrolase domain-containing protein [Nocardia yamanashiensis]UGT44294.1 beta-lactamase family protein [Nocardia yamanashiensis]
MVGSAYEADIDEALVRFGVPGAGWAVIADGRIAQTGVSGVQTAGERQPVTGTTRFQACSISKPVVALAMLRLVDQGVLDLDADINGILRSWRLPRNSDWQPVVTLRQLVSHSAGLTVAGFPGYRRTEQLPTTAQILRGEFPANTAGIRVDTVPGAQFRYSGGGTIAMQLLLEEVTGAPFPALMRELVLDPIGMADSDFTQPPPPALYDVLASGHRATGAVVSGGWHVYPEQAAAGLWTTPSDLCKFALAVRAAYMGAPEGLIPQPLAREMLTPQIISLTPDPLGDLNAVGLGPFLATNGPARFGHSGGNEGFRCHLLAYRDIGVGAAVMTNSDHGTYAMQRVFAAIAKAHDWPDLPIEIETPDLPTESTLASFEGRYRLHTGFEFTVTPTHHDLQVTFDRQPEMTFSSPKANSEGPPLFVSVTSETALRLDGDTLVFLQNGQEVACERLPANGDREPSIRPDTIR